jgi:hypothetical protein
MNYRIGTSEFEAEGRYLTLELRDSTSLLNDPAALQTRLEEDGYLYLRGLHDPDAVLQARREILERLEALGHLDPDAPLMEGVASAKGKENATSSVKGNDGLKTAALRSLVYGEPIMDFYARFLGSKALSYNFQWLRAAAPGAGTPIHADLPYMGRGTQQIYTLWTPIGRLTPEMGPLALCLGSHRWNKIRDTYTASDVDRDRIPGVFTTDPAELVDKFGGRWATTTFEPGDAVIIGMQLLHGSLVNQSDCYRISCDTRFQRADEPIDNRWAGEAPAGHEVLWSANPQLEPLEVSRKRWGV